MRSFQSKEIDQFYSRPLINDDFDLFNSISSSSSSSEHSPRLSLHFNDHQMKTLSLMTSTSSFCFSSIILFLSLAPISDRTITSRHPRIPTTSFRPANRSVLPVFSAPFHCPRERFQVNSIGRPILRPQHYQYHSHGFSYPVRR